MTKSISIILRELEIEDLEDYLYWNHPSCEFHKFNGPYYENKIIYKYNWRIEHEKKTFRG